MGLKIRETSGIQRNLPTTRTNLANNLHQQAANTLSNSSNSVVNTTGTQGYQDFKRGFISWSLFTTSKIYRHLLRQKVCQKISVIITNTCIFVVFKTKETIF